MERKEKCEAHLGGRHEQRVIPPPHTEAVRPSPDPRRLGATLTIPSPHSEQFYRECFGPTPRVCVIGCVGHLYHLYHLYHHLYQLASVTIRLLVPRAWQLCVRHIRLTPCNEQGQAVSQPHPSLVPPQPAIAKVNRGVALCRHYVMGVSLVTPAANPTIEPRISPDLAARHPPNHFSWVNWPWFLFPAFFSRFLGSISPVA